mgnify:CR=1 FL=1
MQSTGGAVVFDAWRLKRIAHRRKDVKEEQCIGVWRAILADHHALEYGDVVLVDSHEHVLYSTSRSIGECESEMLCVSLSLSLTHRTRNACLEEYPLA